MPDLHIETARLDSPEALVLIQALNAELTERYPEEGATHFDLSLEETTPGHGVFLVAYVNGMAVGCGAMRRLDEDEAEVKRMYVEPEARRGGVGRALLARLEAEARRLGVTRLVLETGVRQAEAIALYERYGFERIPLFGQYVDSPLSVCMAKTLV